MEKTARLLVSAGIGATKTIVLTGAMIPFTVAGSDAVFNFGGAIVAVQTLPPGVFVVMHGRVFSAEEVAKDRSRGRFVGRDYESVAPGSSRVHGSGVPPVISMSWS